MRRAELVRRLESLRGFVEADPRREQVITPADAAAELLGTALARDDLAGRSVLDLGTGTGRLAIGAALLGAESVVGVDADAAAVAVARENARAVGVDVRWLVGPVDAALPPADTVVMNPPFGAQSRHADRPFWAAALALARRAVYAFSLADSRTFIARETVARGARIEETRPVRWDLPATFPHHRKPTVPLSVDLWVLRTERNAA